MVDSMHSARLLTPWSYINKARRIDPHAWIWTAEEQINICGTLRNKLITSLQMDLVFQNHFPFYAYVAGSTQVQTENSKMCIPDFRFNVHPHRAIRPINMPVYSQIPFMPSPCLQPEFYLEEHF